MPTGNCSIEEFEARLQSRIAESAADAPRNSGEIPQRSEIALSNIKAEDLAIELGLWIPYSEVLKLGMPFPSGIENEVYFYETSHTVVKINNLITSQSISRLFRRLLMHNAIFPQTKYVVSAARRMKCKPKSKVLISDISRQKALITRSFYNL